MNKRLLISLILCGFVTTMVSAQDPHFSQFWASPLLVNPALTGTGDGNYRVSTIYRDQWRSAIDEPFKTYNLNADFNFEISPRTTSNPDRFGIGLSIFADRVGTFDLNTTSIALFGAYHKALNKNNNSFLSGGIYLGIGQKNVNYEDLTFEDQFNAINGYTLPTGEFLPVNNFGYADLGIGIHYSMSPSKTTHLYAGLGVFHANKPNISFYKSDESPNQDLIRSNPLERKYSIYSGVSLSTNEKWSVQPRVLALIQNNHTEINVGNNFRYLLDFDNSRYFHIGPWLRMTDSVDGFSLESIVLSAGFQMGRMLLGLSYDHNLKDLTGDRAGLSAFEISLNYTGDFDNAEDYCPQF